MLDRFSQMPLSRWNQPQRDLAVCLIILHDIGKTVTLVGQGRTERGGYQPHELAALELLATPLAKLEVSNPLLANQIRGFFKPRDWYPRQYDPIYRLVSTLDRASAGMPMAFTLQDRQG